MPWKVVTMSAEDTKNLKHVHLQNAFGALFIATWANDPAVAKRCAMFKQQKTRGGVFRFYFSPAAAEVAAPLLAAYSAEDVERPSKSELSLWVGVPGAMSLARQ
jgi:hypothetical protein